MDEAKLTEIEARCKAAEPGPWVAQGYNRLHRQPYVGAGDDGRRYVCLTSNASDGSGINDAVFIAAARQDIPALIAALREAWVKIGEMEEDRKIREIGL